MTYETLRQAYSAVCKDRDAYKEGYNALFRDLQARTEQVRELQEEVARMKYEANFSESHKR